MTEKIAIEGGAPVRNTPWPSRVQFDEEELNVVNEVMRSAMQNSGRLWRLGGTKCEEFEQNLAKFFGRKHAVAVSSGTAAVHVALSNLRLDPGCEIITSPITDVGTVTPIIYQNLIPIFADVDPETLNITPESIAERITDRTKAIIPVHLWGAPCDMDPIIDLAEKYNLIVIEDCAQAHGATYKGRKVGSIGDMGVLSMMNGKHITTGGEGGAVITDNEEYYQNGMLSSRSKLSPWTTIRWDIVYPVLNYRLTELQAAIGLVQLKKLPALVQKRQDICMKIAEMISHLQSIKFPKILDDTKSSFWFLPLFVNLEGINVTLDEFAEALRREGIPVGARYTGVPMYEYIFLTKRNTYGSSECPWTCPVHRRDIDYSNMCPNAKKALNQVITVPIHESCTEKDAWDVASALEKVEARYLK